MSQRESHQDEPENINFQNQKPINNVTNDLNKEPISKINQTPVQQCGKNIQLSQIILDEVENALRSVRLFNYKENKSAEDFKQVETIFQKHVTANLRPNGNTDAGDILLRNGHFIVAFISIMTKKQKKNYLKKHLYNYFGELNNISKEKQYFQKQQEKVLAYSPESSRKDPNWSTKVEKDSNSPMKSSVLGSENLRNSEKKMKRNFVAPFPDQVDEREEERSERATKNAKKNTKKSGKKSINKNNTGNIENNVTKKPKQLAYKSKSKSKNNKKDEKKDEKREIEQKNNEDKDEEKNSNIKRQTKSISQLIQTNKNQNQTEGHKLGSHYHYEISLNPKSQKKQLIQVRTSARISHKRSKSKDSKSRSKSNKRKGEQREKKEKRTKKRNEQWSDNDSNYTQESQSISELNEKVQIDWVKKHLKQLNIHNVQLYSEFTALTKDDNKITELLLSMENTEQANEQSRKIQRKKKGSKKKKQDKSEEKKYEENKCGEGQPIQPIQVIQFNEDSFSQTRVMVPKKQQNQEKNDQNNEKNAQNNEKNETDPAKRQEQKKQRFRRFSEIKKQYQINELPLTIQYVVDPNLCNHGIYALLKLGRVTQLEMGTAYAVSPLIFGASSKRKHIKQSLEKASQLAGQYADNIGFIPINELILEMVKRKNEQLHPKPE